MPGRLVNVGFLYAFVINIVAVTVPYVVSRKLLSQPVIFTFCFSNSLLQTSREEGQSEQVGALNWRIPFLNHDSLI